MRRVLLASLVSLLSANAAADTTKGQCTVGDSRLDLTDAVFYTEPNTFDETRQDRVMVFTNVKLDKAKIGEAPDKEDAVRDQVWEADDGGKVEMHVDEENVVWALHYNRGGSSMSQSGSGVVELKLTTNDAKRIAGTFALAAEPDELNCDITFDLSKTGLAEAVASAPPKPVGKALGKGGGEPGKAFLANHAAMRKGDVDAMIATAAEETAAQMRAAKSEPDFPAMLEMMKAFAPATVTVVSGEDFGDTATLKIEGADESGEKMYGTTRMAKEGGTWKVVKTDMSNTPQ